MRKLVTHFMGLFLEDRCIQLCCVKVGLKNCGNEAPIQKCTALGVMFIVWTLDYVTDVKYEVIACLCLGTIQALLDCARKTYWQCWWLVHWLKWLLWHRVWMKMLSFVSEIIIIWQLIRCRNMSMQGRRCSSVSLQHSILLTLILEFIIAPTP